MELNLGTIHQLAVIIRLTLHEARRRKLLWLGLGMGVLFLALFGTGFHFAYEDFRGSFPPDFPFARAEYLLFNNMFLTAALYVVNFLVVMITALTAVGSVSSEIDSGTIHAIAAKPIYRWQIILGKWIGQAMLVALYTALLSGGVMAIVYLISGYVARHALGVMLILTLEGLAVLSVTLLGSASLSTLANGVMVFMLYGLAFVGGWVEQIGTMLESRTAVDLGILSSLLMPSEGLWRYAVSLMQGGATDLTRMGPFMVFSQPTPAFVIYAVLYTLGLLGAAVWAFARRDL